MTSPSSSSAGQPRADRPSRTSRLTVDLPAPDRPVIHHTVPSFGTCQHTVRWTRASRSLSGRQSLHLGFEVFDGVELRSCSMLCLERES